MTRPAASARDIYEVVYEPAGRRSSWIRAAFVMAVNLFTMGDGPANPGGGCYRIIERSSGTEVGRAAEWLGDDDAGHEIRTDLLDLTPEQFSTKWL